MLEGTFSWALNYAQQGSKMKRTGWNGKNMYIAVQYPDKHSKMGGPYLYIKGTDGKYLPWLASQQDLFAVDWEEYKG